MPDTLDATTPLLTIPDALASEAAAVLLGGDPGALKAVQEKLAAALTGQGLPEGAAGSVADGWMRDVAAGVGASATPDDAIAQASRVAAGTAARMAQAAQEAAALTGEQRLAVALAQGQGLGPDNAADSKAASDLSAALFSGVMDPAARPAGAADPIAALSQALTAPPAAPAAAEAVPVSPSDKLAAALASGVGVQDAVTALGPAPGGHFAQALEHALSGGADAAGAIAEAQALSAAGAVQTTSVAVEQTDGARLLGALAAGKTDGAGGAALAGAPAFTSVLNDALAQGAAPDAALGASARAQTDMAARQEAAAVPAKPADALVASLSSGQNVAATVKTFAAAAGLDGAAAGGFGDALGRALSGGQEMAGALGSAQQTVSTALALSAETAKGVKSDGLIAALASGQNVQQAVQALGGSGAAFNAALGQALADGRAPATALAAARQTAETVQQNAQGSEVPVSAENKALADLANPPPVGEATKEGAKGDGDKSGGEKTAEQVAEAPAEGKEGGEKDGGEKDGAKEGDAKEEAKGEDGDKASDNSADKPAADAAPDAAAAKGEASPAPAKSSVGSEPALKAISFDVAGTAKSADPATPSVTAPAPSSGATPATTPVTRTLTSDPFAVAAQIQQQVARAVEAAANALPVTVPPVAAPTLSSGFDAAAFTKALAIAEGTAAPAGFAVFHLIEAMFRPGETGSSVIGVAVVANPDSPSGVWQYSLDGGAWLVVGAVGDGAALVLPGSALLRFLPADNWNGTTPSLGLRAVNSEWTEGFSGAEHRLFTLTGVGGTTPLSADVVPLTLEVTPVNGAPVATDTTAVLAAVTEDSANPAGASVAALFGGLFSDPTDAVFGAAGNGFAGVAVIANPADATQGQWQYWTGSTWAAVGTVSDGAALILAADATLRFLPAANWNGVPPSLTVRLIDDSQGPVTSGERADATAAGGDSRYSLGTVALTTAVSAVNDAPVATGTTATLPTLAEDTANPAGATVSSLFGALFSDAADAVSGGSAANGFAGVVVVGNDATTAQGTWQYWTGSAWAAIGAASEADGLLLATNTALRFVPAANWNGTTPALTVRLVEDGGAPLVTGSRVDLTGGVGGSTVYSAGTIALTGTVTPVNDAPVATGTTTLLPAIAEDTADPSGATVTALFSHLFSDATDTVAGGSAANGFAGIAVVGNAATAQGVWQYWTGTAWAAVGTVSDGDALLLAADATLRFLPAANWNGVPPSLTVRLIDDSQGPVTNGERADVTSAGGDSRYSLGTIALNTAVSAVNDAPVATGTAATLPTIAEDTANPAGATVSSLFGALFSDAADAVSGGSAANGFAGVVVVGNAATTAQGTWQYWTGTAWAGIGAASEANGLLLAANTALRFVPAANWNGTTPALTVRLVEDGGAPLITGNRVDLTGGVGGSTVYSAGTVALTGTVTPVNDAPVATGTTATLPTVAEDTANPAGTTVSSLFGHLFSDATDTVAGGSAANGFAGIAVVGNAATAQGVWQYWTGTGWAAMGAASDGNALLLAANTALRFVPAADWNGTTPALTVRLIDDSQGAVASGGRVVLTSVGGTTAYSAGTVALTGTVTPVNDAPVATGPAATLPTIAEDTANPAGATVSSLFAHLFSDAADAVSGGSAADALAGIVVVGNAAVAAQGAWQYWTGAAWADIGAVSGGHGLLLAANTALRFVPAANWNGTTPALTVRLVDTSHGPIASGARVDATNVGGSTAYSAGTIALTGAVLPVNDAPVATGTTATLPTIAEDTVNPAGTSVTALFGHLFSDPADAVAGGSSANGFAGVAVVGNAATAGQGVWQYWSGFAWITVGAVAEGSALVVAANAMLRFLPAADWNGTTPALTVRLIEDGGAPIVTGGRVDLTTGGVGGSTVYSADTIALTGTVTPVNDAPQITAGTTALATMKGVAVAVTGLSVSDVDAGALPMLVTLTAGHGTLTLASAGWDAVITGNGTDSVTIRATLATINGLLGAANGLLYTAGSYTGADAIRIVVNDLGNGGAGGPLTATATIGVTVAPPNASPVLIDTNLDVAVAAEALAAPTAGTAGFAVSKLVGLNGSGPGNVTDTDAGAVVGIALTGTNESYGRWWFSTDNGATWSLVGAVNDSDSALLLRATDRLYFQPNAAVPATVNGALTIRAWDQTMGSAGSKTAITLGDGSAFSAATDTVTLHPGVLIPNGSFDKGLTGWSYTGGATVGATGDGHEGTLTSAGGQSPTQLENFLGLAHGSIAAATGTIPSFGHAMKLASTVTVTKDTTLTFDWTFIFSDPGYHDFAFVSVNGVVTLLAKEASASGKFSVVIPANTTLTLGFGTSDTSDNSVNPVLRVDNVKLTTVASDPIVLDMAGDGLALRALTDGVLFDVSGDGVADRTGWVGKGNALLVRDDNHNGRIDDGRELVSEHFGKGFNSSLEALASLDSNHDGRIDATDESFATLQVWQDADGDGVSQPGELRTLAEAGILSIATTATPTDTTLAGNHVLGTTSMTMADGSSRLVAGVAFDAQATVAAQLHSQPLAASPAPQADHGRFDYAALLSSGLGLPDNVPVVQSSPDAHNGDWVMALHTTDTHHTTTHASTIVPTAESS
ncbi:hypothetical protein FBZ82_11358 [Azospirillum brasilense]|uniref:RapA2 cadherin-like domain-containing protein n=1 Tax=Azospirillum brasilense TaxID=192 RepID=A0A560ASQ1_AZOBR|nr:hypothetical protein [Azospirillum brasilense]TWA63400.1 hypothetical protein FBZ82_11358 [Azospirillum brasilense]